MKRRFIICLIACLALACSVASAQKDTRDTINSIGRRPPKAATKTTKTTKRIPKSVVKRTAVVHRASPPKQAAPVASGVVKRPTNANPSTTSAPAPPTNRLVVSATGKADARTISEALALAKPGAEIVVGPGVYRESLVLTSPVTITAEDNPSFDPPTIESFGGPCVTSQAGQSSMTGFTFRFKGSAGDAPEQMIAVTAGKLTLERCSIASAPKSGIRIVGDATDALLRKCTIKAEGGPAVAFVEKASGTVEDCTLSGGKPTAVYISTNADPTLRNCRIIDSPGHGVVSDDGALGTLVDCDVHGMGGFGILVLRTANTTVRGGTISRCSDGAVAKDGGRIVVDAVELYDLKATGVSAKDKSQADVKDCHIHDVRGLYGVHVEDEAIVRIDGGEIYQIEKSGVWARNRSTITVTNLTIRDCGFEGISVKDGSEARIDGCTISATRECGIGVLKAKANVTRCKITGTQRYGIGLTPDATVSVRECIVEGNARGGIDAPNPKALTVIDSKVQR